MNALTPIRSESQPAGHGPWSQAIDRAVAAAEAAELELSRQGGNNPTVQRKASGSYYTPSDVAGHFWDLFFRHHRIHDLASLLTFIGTHDMVEPSAGSGMFVFSFLQRAALLGATPENLKAIRFHVIDINLSALRFFAEQMRQIEGEVGVVFEGIGPSQNDFRAWSASTNVPNAIFVGNPPFVSNSSGHRWRNLYADFVEAMLNYRSVKGVSLILPLSVCFSRDYAELRAKIRSAGLGISASSYDNIPDCLFRAGKPDSTNSNRANSQRCTILNLGGPNPLIREASPLLRWSAEGRATMLSNLPHFRAFLDNDGSGQFPRPASDLLVKYLSEVGQVRPLRAFLSRIGRPVFAVGGVARNYIGLREIEEADPGTILVKVAAESDRSIVLQALSSRLFYDYWLTYGDGFHVTADLVDRFPVTDKLARQFQQRQDFAHSVWSSRAAYAKEKLNSGKMIRSYDLRAAFDET